jgi:hypothetical protein
MVRRQTFPDDRGFWEQSIQLYESKVWRGARVKEARGKRARELREIRHEIDHFKKKVKDRFDPTPTKKPSGFSGPPRFGDLDAITKSFRKWLKTYNARNGTKMTLLDYLKRVRAHSSLRDFVADWKSVEHPALFNQVAAGVIREVSRTWRLTNGVSLKHAEAMATLRQASRLVSTEIEAGRMGPADSRSSVPFILPPLQHLPWQLLPGGDWTVNTIIGRLRVKFQNAALRGKPIDEDRLRKIVTWLNPSRCYVGSQEFDGYLVFGFDDHATVLLECPIYGNAIYLIRGDWVKITQLTKGRSLSRHPDQVRRVIHGSDWIHKLQAALRTWR